MNNRELAQARHYLGKTQRELSRLLCVSTRTIQSFEQGWRNIPASVERQILFLLSLKRSANQKNNSCWEMLDCPAEWRANCTVWEFKAGYFCLFVNGTSCHGKIQKNWHEKMKVCQECEVYNSIIPVI
jgi:DNA-binding XRE family transcriptional regulator